MRSLALSLAALAVAGACASGSNATRTALRGCAGADFDRAYIANEVDYHRAVLSAIDDALIPSGQNAELRALLVSVRPAIAAHLQHAEWLKQQLAN